jgi:tetratricopeptide (TPR) repeat protein
MRMRHVVLIAVALCFVSAASAQPPKYDRNRAMIEYRLGYEEMRAEQWEKAAAAFERAIDIDPSFQMAYYGLGRALMPQKKYPQAVAALTRCRDLYRQEAGKQFTSAQDAQRYRSERLTEIDEMVRQIQSGPQTAQRAEQARQLGEQRRQIQDAIQRGNAVTMEATVPPWVSLALGSAFFRMERFPDAEREYKAAIAADAKTGEAHNNLAVVYLETGRFGEAEKAISAAEKSGFRVNPQLKADIRAAGKKGG